MIGIDAASPGAASHSTNHAYLGVVLGNALGESGAMVELVGPGTPAEESGIQLGDVITAIDGQAISGPQAASAVIGAMRPGASALFALDRFGQPISLRVTLGSRASAAP